MVQGLIETKDHDNNGRLGKQLWFTEQRAGVPLLYVHKYGQKRLILVLMRWHHLRILAQLAKKLASPDSRDQNVPAKFPLPAGVA